MLVLATVGGLHERSATAAAGFTAPKALGTFEATIHRGPDAGLMVQGVLQLGHNKSNEVMGQVVRKRGSAIPVSGQLNGLAINLVFYLGHGQHVFGVGTVGQDPGMKHWFMGGPLVGPKPGDSGDWFLASTGTLNIYPPSGGVVNIFIE
jgi:hypothetical protein